MMDSEDVLEEFEESWARGTNPDIRDFIRDLGAKGTSTDMARELLPELIKIDLHHRWRMSVATKQDGSTVVDSIGARTPIVEEYLKTFSAYELRGELLSLLEDEVLARFGVGDQPTVKELSTRFPDIAESELLEILARTAKYIQQHHGSEANAPQTFEERFEVRRLLGQGGMGRVYLAFDPRLQREVAVKVPIMDLRRDKTARERFLREGQLAASLNHPNAVAVYEINEIGGQCYIVAEYVAGPTLSDWLAEVQGPLAPAALEVDKQTQRACDESSRKLSASAVASLVHAMASAIQEAHGRGILHRDLKPANVMVEVGEVAVQGQEGWVNVNGSLVRPRITDFGLASCVGELSALTTSGAVLGTAAYMAPEQATGLPIGPQADVFSLGLILYEMLCGVRPFEGQSFVDVVDRFRGTQPIQIPKRRAVPADLKTICERCLQFDTADRYSSAGDVAADLHRFILGQPTKAKPIGLLARVRRFLSMPIRIKQAAYSAIALEGAVIISLVFAIVMQLLGFQAGQSQDMATFLGEVVLLCITQLVPILVLGLLTLRRQLWAFGLNCVWVLAMAFIVSACLVTGSSPLTYYGDNELAYFAAHSLILGVSSSNLLLHVLAIPAAIRIYKQEQRWI